MIQPPWISNKGSEGSSRCTVNKNSIFLEIKGPLNWKKVCPEYDDLQVLVHCDLWLESGICCITTEQCHSLSFGWKLTFSLFWLFPKVCYRKNSGWADCIQTYNIWERDHVLLPHSKWFAASNKSNDTGKNSCEEMDSS